MDTLSLSHGILRMHISYNAWLMVFIVLPEVNKLRLRLRQNRSKLRLRPSGSRAQHYLFDPEIASATLLIDSEYLFGVGNLTSEAITAFIENHVCNKFCALLKLKPFPKPSSRDGRNWHNMMQKDDESSTSLWLINFIYHITKVQVCKLKKKHC